MSSLSPGTRLGPYEVVSLIGAGGMGEVYRARDTRLDRTVALKVLSAHVAATSTARERFEREARAISALNHPNICTLFDVGSANGTEYLVMELIDGEARHDADARPEVFDRRTVLYEMSTGQRAVKAQSKASLIAKIMSEPPTAIGQLQPIAPPSLHRLLMKCLAKDPEERWQCASDVASE